MSLRSTRGPVGAATAVSACFFAGPMKVGGALARRSPPASCRPRGRARTAGSAAGRRPRWRARRRRPIAAQPLPRSGQTPGGVGAARQAATGRRSLQSLHRAPDRLRTPGRICSRPACQERRCQDRRGASHSMSPGRAAQPSSSGFPWEGTRRSWPATARISAVNTTAAALRGGGCPARVEEEPAAVRAAGGDMEGKGPRPSAARSP